MKDASAIIKVPIPFLFVVSGLITVILIKIRIANKIGNDLKCFIFLFVCNNSIKYANNEKYNICYSWREVLKVYYRIGGK